MRYYHPFPEAIPLSEAGCSRVTPPSATKNIKQAQCSPFDLHVLSVPPAFVLSQDQTLYDSCISIIPFRMTWNQSCFITLALLLSCFLVLSWLSFSFLQRNFKGRYFFLHCLVFKMLFLLGVTSASFIISQLFQFVKYFFKFFSNYFFAARCRSFELQLLYYITPSSLCQVLFWKLFSKLSPSGPRLC